MGAGDVKLMAGMGAWVGATTTWYAFCVSVVVGALMAVAMAAYRGKLKHHANNFMIIFHEWLSVRDPRKLAAIAAERKPSMLLLPYGIPICIGSIAYFFYAGLIDVGTASSPRPSYRERAGVGEDAVPSHNRCGETGV